VTAVLFGGGGTGGHVTPALAAAEALRAVRPDVDVAFVGTARGLEAELVPAAGWTLHTVEALPLRRTLSPATLQVPVVVARAAGEVRRLIAARGVAAACVFGGYVSGPLALAARRARIPLVVHEQNAVPGLANRLAARWAAAIAVSVPAAADAFRRRERVIVTGNPVRADLAGLDRPGRRAEAAAAFDLEPGRRTLLVFGGSLGARRLNDAVLEAAGRWGTPERLQILHAAGRRDHERVAAAWDAQPERGLRVRCLPFVERMDLAYALADLALCRAGASTIAELAVAGVPAVLVPYPHAAADEQTANAAALADAGAAVLVPDVELDGAALVGAAEPVLHDPGRAEAMAAAARALGRPDAARRLAALVLAAAEGNLPDVLAGMREDGDPR
jgi:UDP-N-acetylglucosamine--N-acetylmuramyl-(pentapeptide) pyrophosphoryl-undecaprenol N-acetylglucosamine transferase